MESGDHHEKRLRKDDNNEDRKNKEKRRRHRHKPQDHQSEKQSNLSREKRLNISEDNRRKRNKDGKGHHKHKSHEGDTKEKGNGEIQLKRSNKQKSRRESTIEKKSVETCLENKNIPYKQQFVRSFEHIYDCPKRQPLLRKYKTFHSGQRPCHKSRSPESKDHQRVPKKKKHRAKSEKPFDENQKVSQIWYCHVDTDSPFRPYGHSEERPGTVPKKIGRKSHRRRERARSTPDGMNVELSHRLHPELVYSKLHRSTDPREAYKTSCKDINKKDTDVSKIIEEECTKKMENNLKSYFVKIEKLIDKKLNTYLHLKNLKLRETLEGNLKYIERERNQHKSGNINQEKQSKPKKNRRKSATSAHTGQSEKTKPLHDSQKRSTSKLTAKIHQSYHPVIPVEESFDEQRRLDVPRPISKVNKDARTTSKSPTKSNDRRGSKEASPNGKRERKTRDDGDDYKEIQFEHGYLRDSNPAKEDKLKKCRKYKTRIQQAAQEMPVNADGRCSPRYPVRLDIKMKNKVGREEINSSIEQGATTSKSCNTTSKEHEVPVLQSFPSKNGRVAKRNAKIQHDSPVREPHFHVSNENKVAKPASVIYFKPTFSKENITNFSVCNKDTNNVDYFPNQRNQIPTEDYGSRERRSYNENEKNSYIVEGIEPAKRLNSPTKVCKKNHLQNLECKTVSVITIPSHNLGIKYFPLEGRQEVATDNTNKMKRLKLYYQYSVDSNKCSGSEEQSFISESLKIFSDYSDNNNHFKSETIRETLSDEKHNSFREPPKMFNKINDVEKLLENNWDTEFLNARTKQNETNNSFNPFQDNFENAAAKQGDTRRHVRSKSAIDIPNRTVDDNISKVSELQGSNRRSVKLQNSVTGFNDKMFRNRLQTQNSINNQSDNRQNPNHLVLQYLENMYQLYLATLPQYNCVGYDLCKDFSIKMTSDQNQLQADSLNSKQNKTLSVEAETTTNDIMIDEHCNGGDLQMVKSEKSVGLHLHNKSVNTSRLELGIDNCTTYLETCSTSKLSRNARTQSVNKMDQMTSCHNTASPEEQSLNRIPSHMSNYRTNNKLLKSSEVMTVIDVVNNVISKSVTTMVKDLEDLGKKKKLELEASKEEIIKIFGTAKHDMDVQALNENIKDRQTAALSKSVLKTVRCMDVQTARQISEHTDVDAYSVDNDYTNDKIKIQKRAKKNLANNAVSTVCIDKVRRNETWEYDRVNNSIINSETAGLTKDKLLYKFRDKLKEANKCKVVQHEQVREAFENKERGIQNNHTKRKSRENYVEKTGSVSKIFKRPPSRRTGSMKNEAASTVTKQDPLKKSKSEISIRQLHSGRDKGRISSLVCLHRYTNDSNFTESSNSCLENYYFSRTVANDNNLASRLLLTKDYRTPQMSSYKRRKMYDEVIRNKIKKRTQVQDKKMGQVFEVRYLTLDKNSKDAERAPTNVTCAASKLLKTISETSVEENLHESFQDFIQETNRLLTNKEPKKLLKFIQQNVDKEKQNNLVGFLRKLLDSYEQSELNTNDDTYTEVMSFFKTLNTNLTTQSDPAKPKTENECLTGHFSKPTSSNDSTACPDSDTYTLSKKSITPERCSCPTIGNSDASFDFLCPDDNDVGKNTQRSKKGMNPILGFALKSDTNLKKTETSSFVESQHSEESGYVSSGRSKLSFSSFFKNPTISELLKPRSEGLFRNESSPYQDILDDSAHEDKREVPLKSPMYGSYDEIPTALLREADSVQSNAIVGPSLRAVCKPDQQDTTESTNTAFEEEETNNVTEKGECSCSSDRQRVDDIHEEVPIEILLNRESCGNLAVRRSISAINFRKECRQSKSFGVLNRVRSDTTFENQKHIVNTVQYVNECGNIVFTRQMKLYTEIVENESTEDMLVLRRLLDSGVYLIATNFNTGYITLMIDARESSAKESKDDVPEQNVSYERYDASTCDNPSEVKRLVTRKFFENLLRVYERETIVSSMLYDDKDFIQNQLFASIHNIKEDQSIRRFRNKMRSFLRRIFSSKPKILESETSEKMYPLEENYQRNFQILADNAIQDFAMLVETVHINPNINDEMTVCGFLTLLEKIKNGHFTFLKVEKNVNVEEDIRNQIKQAFRNMYLTANSVANRYHRKLTNSDINLVGAFVCKYRIGLLTRIDLIASYLGKGFFDTELQLKAAVIYLMKVLTSIIELDNFENHCKNTGVSVEK